MPYVIACGHSLCSACLKCFLGACCPVDECPIPHDMSIVRVNIVRVQKIRLAAAAKVISSLNLEREAAAIELAKTYVKSIKVRFGIERPEIYSSFIEILHNFRDRGASIESCIDNLFTLFPEYPEILSGFSNFVPPEHQHGFRARLAASLVI